MGKCSKGKKIMIGESDIYGRSIFNFHITTHCQAICGQYRTLRNLKGVLYFKMATQGL